jgi:hypothetical protein
VARKLERKRAVITGPIAGVGALGALALSDRFERAWLGRPPVYTPEHIVTRLFGRRPRLRARAAGTILRCGYGLLIAAAWSRLVSSRTCGTWRRALGLGAAIFAFELVALPALGATPPLRRWSRAEKALLAWHTQVFGFGEEVTRHLLSGRMNPAVPEP